MKYDFDKVIDRRHTDALKIDYVPELWGRDDLMPLWVADMDFATPPFILNALKQRCEHPVLGYTCRARAWYEAIVRWQQMRYGWTISEEWLNFVPGIVPGIAFSLHCFTRPGDKVLIQTPVYHPYILVPKNNGRVVVESPLRIKNEESGIRNEESGIRNKEYPRSYSAAEMTIDWEDFERKAGECKLFLLCHPHNPGGRVWKHEELVRMAEICQRKGVLVVSDEIHADLTLHDYTHIPFASSCEAATQNSITFASPSKSFNMAGLTSSYAIIPNPDIRAQFATFLENSELNLGHLFSFISVAAAYSHGTEWLDQCLDYIQGNIDFVERTLAHEMPRICMIRPQASYLIFLDCRALGLTPEALNRFFVEEAHLALNEGAMFGKPGEGFMRLNVASPRSVIKQAMHQLKEAYDRRF
jgi:Bifunctional PLP-dependent enzyme with beta-cystathionase and maltose regulon repressor activities